MFFIIRGLPGSGKSTTAKMLYNRTDTFHFEADMFFVNTHGEYKFDGSKISDAHEWCYNQTEKALEISTRIDSVNVIVSNTFTRKKELRPYFELAKKYNIKPQVITCQGDFGNVHSVPQETIVHMKQRFDFNCVDELMKEYF